MKILSVDDSRAVHALIGEILEGAGASVSHVYDGEEALAVLGAAGAPSFDLILLDWEMPKLTGIETLKRLRSMGIQTPVVMLTSKNSTDDIMNALTAGANEYVMKPFTGPILIDKLESVLGRTIA